ncbi:MAG: cobaltochelatase subunit CobN, partial [Candidatus Methanomethylophilaceae archaeon]|nr:cobaltochelatase subunit CobN [Candidatus Methanomethylophilaceae archaeon]
MRRIFVMLWASHRPILERIKDDLDVELDIAEDYMLDSEDEARDVADRILAADAAVIYRHNGPFMDMVEGFLQPHRSESRIVCMANDPAMWGMTTVDHEVAVRCFMYMQASGEENFRRLFDYVCKAVLGDPGEPLPPIELPYEAVVDIDTDAVYLTTEEMISSVRPDPSLPFVGVIGSRPSYMADHLAPERQFCRHLRAAGLNPILIYCMFSKRSDLGTRSHIECIKEFFSEPRVSAIVKFSTAFIGNSKYDREPDEDDKILETLNVPVYQPIMSARMSVEEWRESHGITTDITWQVAFPEFEGIIGPYFLGSDAGAYQGDDNGRTVAEERANTIAWRIANDIALQKKPNRDKKVVIFLNNFPCNGVEANVGNAAGLDSLESVADIIKRLAREGYDVDPPKDGKGLITRILDSKALSEFRWTTAVEMKRCGGVMHEMDADEYRRYFDTLSEKAREDVKATWGEPPGQAMTLDGKILVTGVSFGNVAVAVQPKRGCYGARCDGKVCKILHDPACPPTHQYLATYHYYEDVWGADLVIHTGTHGSMEWTPGKGVGLSESCYPDICMNDTPHLYIYNSDNPAEGLVAKRRSYATLVDHMQNLMMDVELYGGFAELDSLLDEYAVASKDPALAEELRKSILEKASELKLVPEGMSEDATLEECVKTFHEELSKMENSQVNKGLHIFGRMPEGKDLSDAVFSIVRYGEEHDSLRDVVSELMGYDLSEIYRDKGAIDPKSGECFGEVIREVGDRTKAYVAAVLDGKEPADAIRSAGLEPGDRLPDLERYRDLIMDVAGTITASDEVGSLLNGMSGGFIRPGPSGYVTRGRYDIMPTGRNFYSMDPHSVPSRSAWKVGMRIADATIDKYVKENGELPESIGLFWTMGELISTGGELMSELMYLIGTRPVWEPDGRVHEFEVIPLEELGRPRIDLSINISCILRDNMLNAIDLMDAAITAVATLDEPDDMNFVRKHTLQSVGEGMSVEDACARMFGAPPGTYTSGVNLAVFASAWEDPKDLADVFVRTKGHGYGGGRNGKPMYEQFATVLSRTDIVYDGAATDEVDILSCSCRFSNIGGMTVASRYLSGKDVKTYFGDVRDPRDLSVGTLAEEFKRCMRIRTLNPAWVEAMKEHGYKGANDIAKRIVRLMGWQATTGEVEGWMFDESFDLFVRNEENRRFFEENNPYALEELERRLLEAHTRGLWETDEDTLRELQETYLEIESMLEERAG